MLLLLLLSYPDTTTRVSHTEKNNNKTKQTKNIQNHCMEQMGKKTEMSNKAFPTTCFCPNKATAGLWSTRTYLDIWQWSTECPVQRTSDPVLHIWNQANATIQLTWSQKKIHRRKCLALHFCHLTFLYSVVFISVEFLAVFQKKEQKFYWIKLKLFLAHINWSLKLN